MIAFQDEDFAVSNNVRKTNREKLRKIFKNIFTLGDKIEQYFEEKCDENPEGCFSMSVNDFWTAKISSEQDFEKYLYVFQIIFEALEEQYSGLWLGDCYRFQNKRFFGDDYLRDDYIENGKIITAPNLRICDFSPKKGLMKGARDISEIAGENINGEVYAS